MFNQNELNEMTRRYQDWNTQFKQPFYMFQSDKPSLIQRVLVALRSVKSLSTSKTTVRRNAPSYKPLMSGK